MPGLREGDLEDALMRPFELPPREEGEADGLPRIILECSPGEETYIEGAPLVMPGSAGEHAALQVVAEARGLQPFHRFPLWEVVDEPQGWHKYSQHS